MANRPGTSKTASPAGRTWTSRPPASSRPRHPAACSRQEGFDFDLCYTSVLKRATRTLWHCLDELDRTWLPVVHSWRLNERHYGALQGLNKAETAKKFGDEQVLVWRRSYDVPPPPLEPGDPRSERGDIRYAKLSPEPDSPDRMPEGHRGPGAALLERVHGPGDQGAQARAGGRPRQLDPGPGEIPGRHFRRRHRRPEHPQWHSPGVRAG